MTLNLQQIFGPIINPTTSKTKSKKLNRINIDCTVITDQKKISNAFKVDIKC